MEEIIFPEVNTLDKDITLAELLVKCKIPRIGPKVAEKIAKKVMNVVTLRDLIECENLDKVLDTVDGVGDKTKAIIGKHLRNFDFMIFLDNLEETGEFTLFEDDKVYELENICVVENEEDEKEEDDDTTSTSITSIAGKKVCITGTLSMPRAYFKNFIEKHGGVFQAQVNGATDILIYSKADGTYTEKYKKAHDINLKAGKDVIAIMTEKAFVNLTKTIKKVRL